MKENFEKQDENIQLKNDIISSLDTCSSNTLKKIVSAIE
jgi:hypothetical protein